MTPLMARSVTPWALFARASRTLARRARGQAESSAPDWLDPRALQSLSLALPGRGTEAPALNVAVAEGIPLSALPQHLGGLRLAAIRAPRALAQLAPEVFALSNPGVRGTATGLVTDMLSPRQFVLTCGHVAAGLPGASVNDRVDLLIDGLSRQGRLVDWQPSIGLDVLRTGLDAALVEVAANDALALRSLTGWMSSGVNPRPTVDLPVTLRRASSPLAGLLKVFWSGFVDVPGYTPGVADYFLEGGVGYLASQPTVGGDSGGAVWDSQDRLMGMHVGGLLSAQGGDANAVYAPIQPVLDWYSVRLQTRGGMGHPAPAPAAAPAAPPVLQAAPAAGIKAFPASELETVACTLWGEARNQGEAGMRAVAAVIENRRKYGKHGYRGKSTATEVCLDPWQFSCWNSNDVNLGRMRAVVGAPDAQYRDALRIADEVVRRMLRDTVNCARHYFAVTLPQPPYWAKGKTPCAVVGDHLFFNDID